MYVACNFIYLNILPLDGSAAGATILERGIKYATEDRVGTAVMSQMLGATGGTLMAIAIMLSTFGCCNGLILAGSRVYYAMAKDGLFFKSVAKLHPTYKTPAVSLMVQMVWTCILCVSGSYGQLLDYIIFAVLVFYILTIFGLFVSAAHSSRRGTSLSRDWLSGTAGDLYCDGFIYRCRTITLQTAVHLAGTDHRAARHSGVFPVVAATGHFVILSGGNFASRSFHGVEGPLQAAGAQVYRGPSTS